MTPRRDTFLFRYSQQIPFLRLGPLKGFRVTERPSRALDSPCLLLPEKQRGKDTFRCPKLVTKVPGHCQEQLTQTLIVHLLKKHRFRCSKT